MSPVEMASKERRIASGSGDHKALLECQGKLDHGALKDPKERRGRKEKSVRWEHKEIRVSPETLAHEASLDPKEIKARWEQREAWVSLRILASRVQKDPKEKMASEERDRKEMQQTWTQERALIANNVHGEVKLTQMTAK